METRLQSGTLYSAIGHAGVILWVVLGDWLFAPDPAPEIIATQVSMMSEAEFQALQSAAPAGPAATPEQPQEIATPEPVQPDPPAEEPAVEPPPAPEPEPQPEPDPLPPSPEPQPEEVAVAPEEQPLPSLSDTVRPKPKPADRVAPDPVDVPEDAQTAEVPEEAVSETPSETPQEPQEAQEEVLPEESGDVLRTEATEEQDQSLGMTASIRPKSRPARPETPAEAPAEETQVAAAEPAEEPAEDPAADAIAAALAEAAAEETSAEAADAGGGETQGASGPPLNAGEIGDIRSAIGNKWNLGSVSTDTMRTVIVVRVEFSPEGRPVDISLIESDGPTQAAVDTAFSAARRAIQRAYTEGGIPLPPDKYDTWRVVEFVFDANGMRFR